MTRIEPPLNTPATSSESREPSGNDTSTSIPPICTPGISPDSGEPENLDANAAVSVSQAPVTTPPQTFASAALSGSLSGPQSWAQALRSAKGTTSDDTTSLPPKERPDTHTNTNAPRHYIITSGQEIGIIREE
ncbi:hypothetical protein CVT26_009582 [Gymnopilus dilepis]|uniref:Uncharacterized protein n=1 Tax=Gymnopilus dilepis TaxID=231916 RepID=A0A409YIM6_9AGAR|nr:hypothetical protein CVT26_009582 [Gymnopilus dilepis]